MCIRDSPREVLKEVPTEVASPSLSNARRSIVWYSVELNFLDLLSECLPAHKRKYARRDRKDNVDDHTRRVFKRGHCFWTGETQNQVGSEQYEHDHSNGECNNAKAFLHSFSFLERTIWGDDAKHLTTETAAWFRSFPFRQYNCDKSGVTTPNFSLFRRYRT